MTTHQRIESQDGQTICSRRDGRITFWGCTRLEEHEDGDRVWARTYQDAPGLTSEAVLQRFTAEWAASLGAQA